MSDRETARVKSAIVRQAYHLLDATGRKLLSEIEAFADGAGEDLEDTKYNAYHASLLGGGLMSYAVYTAALPESARFKTDTQDTVTQALQEATQ